MSDQTSKLLGNRPNREESAGRLSYESSTGSRTLHLVSPQSPYTVPGGYTVPGQRGRLYRRNDIVVHTAAKVSHDKSYDARGNFVHFAESNMRNLMQGPGSVRIYANRDTWYDSEKVVEVRKFLRGRAFSLVAIICGFIALFSPDISELCQVPSNTELDVPLTFAFLIFTVELIGLSIAEMSYPFSLFFWMDLLSTLSMVFDISYLFGVDATEPEYFSGYTFAVRASRVARFGARIGRISRAVKFIRIFVLCSDEGKDEKGKLARAISNQLSAILSTRVAFLTITIAVTLPVFAMFNYPTVDESLMAWTLMLSASVKATQNSTSANITAARHDLSMELRRFAKFYSRLSYGPFKICFGEEVAGEFRCRPSPIDLILRSRFAAPRRRNSIWQVKSENLQVWYNLEEPKQMEATINICSIVVIIILMISSGMIMSGRICEIALEPLENMMSLVRGRCAQIFKYTKELQIDDPIVRSRFATDDADIFDKQHVSEFVILEKVVSKLAEIANISATSKTPEFSPDKEMSQEGLMNMHFMGMQPKDRLTKMDPSKLGRGFRSIAADEENEEIEDDIGPDSPMLATMHDNLPADVLESLSYSTFNAFDLSRDTKVMVAAYSVLIFAGSESWVRTNVHESKLYAFVAAVEMKYLPNPYHNFSHALDVLNAVYRALPLVGAEGFLSDISQFWLLIAAISHDVGHLGVNNQYLIEVSHELALTYNDRSPLENMHCAQLFQVVNEAETDIFNHIGRDLYKEIRKGIIDAILHTDVLRHREMMRELGILYQMNSDAFTNTAHAAEILKSSANTQLIMNAMLHFADISNPMRPWELSHRMAFFVLEEFFGQGDLEKAAGIPVQMLNDREKVNMPNSQIGFIEFVITPVVESMINLFPQLDELADNLGRNITLWFELWVGEAEPAEDVEEKVQVRVTKVVQRCRALMRSSKSNHSNRSRDSQARQDSCLKSPKLSKESAGDRLKRGESGQNFGPTNSNPKLSGIPNSKLLRRVESAQSFTPTNSKHKNSL